MHSNIVHELRTLGLCPSFSNFRFDATFVNQPTILSLGTFGDRISYIIPSYKPNLRVVEDDLRPMYISATA
jgi:hypothetical protein